MSLVRQQHAISEAVDTAMRSRDITTLQRALGDTDPNLLFVRNDAEFAGMELSVYTKDWGMMLVFYFAGADPATHWFRGFAHQPNQSATEQTMSILPSVYTAKLAPTEENSGFSRLWMIVQETVADTQDTPKVKAALWLLEQLHESAVESDAATISTAQSNLYLLNPTFDWNAAFSDPVAELKATIRVLGGERELPIAIVDRMAALSIQELLRDIIRMSLQEHVTSMTSEEPAVDEE